MAVNLNENLESCVLILNSVQTNIYDISKGIHRDILHALYLNTISSHNIAKLLKTNFILNIYIKCKTHYETVTMLGKYNF